MRSSSMRTLRTQIQYKRLLLQVTIRDLHSLPQLKRTAASPSQHSRSSLNITLINIYCDFDWRKSWETGFFLKITCSLENTLARASHEVSNVRFPRLVRVATKIPTIELLVTVPMFGMDGNQSGQCEV